MNEDKLTGLQDRASFMQRLKLHCEQAITMGHLLGLVIIDLDRFYRINDQFGFQVGDEALRHVASLATGAARKRDLVARIGGNQFALILPGIMNQGHAVLAAAKLFRMMEAPIELCGHKVLVKGSAGIAVSPNHSSNFDRLFAHAERAMRQARESEESYRLSDADADESDDNAVSLEFELESAFASGDLRMFFQPKVQMSSRRPVGAEALEERHSRLCSAGAIYCGGRAHRADQQHDSVGPQRVASAGGQVAGSFWRPDDCHQPVTHRDG